MRESEVCSSHSHRSHEPALIQYFGRVLEGLCRSLYKAMATGSSEATLPDTEFGIKDTSALHEALCPVSAKYKFFGLQIGVDINQIKEIKANCDDSSDCLLEILCSRLNQEPALTCADICKALRSRSVNERQLANSFQSRFMCESIGDELKEIKKESGKKKKAEKVSESGVPLRMSAKEREYFESESESKNDDSEIVQKVKSAEEERQRDEPKSKQAKKRAREREKFVSIEQPKPDELRRDEMKGSEKRKVRLSEMAASPESGAESGQKIKKSVKESETKMIGTDSESELSDTYTKKETYSESDKYKNPQKYKEKMKIHQKQESVIKVHQKAATASDKLDSDNDECQPWQPKRLKTMEIECETLSYYSGSSNCESESEIPKSKKFKYFPHKLQSITGTSTGNLKKPHYELKEHERLRETEKQRKREVSHSEEKTRKPEAHSSGQASDESENDCENEESDSGNDSGEDGEDSEGKSSDEEEKTQTDEESFTPPSEEKKKEKSVSHEKENTKKEGFEEERKLGVNKAAVEQSKYDSPQGGRQFDETHTRKVKGKRESEAASLKYDSPGDDEQSVPGHGSRDQEEHDIQQKRRKKKKQRRESSMSPTAIGSSSSSTSQEEKKQQPVSKKQGHRKKHVRKMKEKRERMKRGKEKTAHSSGTDDSSPECELTKNQYESDMREFFNIFERFQCKGEMKELVNIFERFFGQLCCAVFGPKDIAAKLQKKGLISIDEIKHMMRSPQSQQDKIITLVDWVHEKIKSCPDHLFVIIEVMLENEGLQETAREILRETGTQCLVCALHFVLDSKTLFPAGRVCPVETAAKFPSQVPPSDTAVPSTAYTLSPTDKSGLKIHLVI